MTSDLLARQGIACPTINGAGTGIFEFESASGVYTELQCGSYIFMDADYGRNLDRDGVGKVRFRGWQQFHSAVQEKPADNFAYCKAVTGAGSERVSWFSLM